MGRLRQLTGTSSLWGTIHEGGILQATGNVYLLGKTEGIVSAGFPDNNSAVIVGDVTHAQQVSNCRFSHDFLTMKSNRMNQSQSFFVNDLHKLAYLRMDELKKLRPKNLCQVWRIFNYGKINCNYFRKRRGREDNDLC